MIMMLSSEYYSPSATNSTELQSLCFVLTRPWVRVKYWDGPGGGKFRWPERYEA